MQLQTIGPAAFAAPAAAPAASRQPAGGPSFQDVFGRAQDLQLSKHAAKRVDRRDLALDAGQMDRLSNAVSKAAEKGSKSSVVMLDGMAVVVDVRQRTVVTAMNAQGGDPRVFTNIDSVVVA